MANYPLYGPGRRAASPGGQHKPTLKDYERLVSAYRELEDKHQELLARYQRLQKQYQALQDQAEEQAGKLHQVEQALSIKEEALQRQQADMKAMESELVWAKAALQQQEQQAKQNEEEQSWKEKYLRLQAEMENVRQRTAREMSETRKFACLNLMKDLLDVSDNIQRAVESSEQSEEANSLLEGFKMVA